MFRQGKCIIDGMPRRKTPTRDNALTLVLQQLHAAGAISRQQIVESTGLTRAAVAEKSTQLIELGQIGRAHV